MGALASLSALLLAFSTLYTLTSAQYGQVQTPAPYTTGVVGNTTVSGNGTGIDVNGKFVIQAEGIRAYFIPYGASITNLFINDTHGIERDIVLGWDNATYYTEDKLHPHYGGVPGRYANRIKNSTFTINGVTSNILPNEHMGQNTLHGGPDGWDWRNWTVVAHTTDSITFAIADPDGAQGFPGEVVSHVTYTVTPYAWHIRMTALSLTKTTPIMLSSHTYWNLDGFQNPNTPLALNHTLYMPYSGQRVDVDNILIPTGQILSNQMYSVNDFWSSPKQVGANFTSDAIKNNCGPNCTGYDTCYLINRNGPYSPHNYDWQQAPVVSLQSNWSGIKVDIFTDQDAFQIYGCGGMNGSASLKNTQGFFGNATRPRVVEQYGCVVMEIEDWIDAINQPEWGRDSKQIFGPGDAPYLLQATYEFSVTGGPKPSRGNNWGNHWGYGGMKRRST